MRPIIELASIGHHNPKAGTATCECGRTISANKLFCMACVAKYTAMVKEYVTAQ